MCVFSFFNIRRNILYFECGHITNRLVECTRKIKKKVTCSLNSVKTLYWRKYCSLPVDPLPPKRIRNPSVPHAPVRNHRLNETEQKVWRPLVSFALLLVRIRPMRCAISHLVSAQLRKFSPPRTCTATAVPFMPLLVCADCDISSASNLLSLRHTMCPLRRDPGCAFPSNNLLHFYSWSCATLYATSRRRLTANWRSNSATNCVTMGTCAHLHVGR